MYRRISHSIPAEVYKYIAIVITLYLQIACGSHVGAGSGPAKASPEAIRAAVTRADEFFASRNGRAELEAAVNELAKVRDPDQRDFEVEWKFAKYSYFLGKAAANDDEAVAAFERGKQAATIASRVEPSKPDGHFWLGANLGELSRISPVTVGLRSVDDIQRAMEAVIAIDPAYQGASAFDALGQLEMATRSLSGTTEKAIAYFEKGILLAPDNSNLRLHLAEAYLSAKRDPDAKRQLDYLFAMPPPAEFKAEHLLAVQKGRVLAEKNFK